MHACMPAQLGAEAAWGGGRGRQAWRRAGRPAARHACPAAMRPCGSTNRPPPTHLGAVLCEVPGHRHLERVGRQLEVDQRVVQGHKVQPPVEFDLPPGRRGRPRGGGRSVGEAAPCARAPRARAGVQLRMRLPRECACPARRRLPAAAHHPVADLQHAAHARLERAPHILALLGVHDLVVRRLQAPEDLEVADVDHRPLCQFLRGRVVRGAACAGGPSARGARCSGTLLMSLQLQTQAHVSARDARQ